MITASFPNKMTDNEDVYKSEAASQIAAVKAFATPHRRSHGCISLKSAAA